MTTWSDDRAWSDDRLAEAFLARAAARPTPQDLAEATIDRVRRTAPRSRTRLGFGSVGALAAAAAVVVVVGAIAIGQMAAEPGEDATAAFGLPILSVSEALAIRDTDPTDREIAIRGFFAPALPVSCPAPSGRISINPIRIECPLLSQWLLENPELLVDASPNAIEGRAPVGPAFHPVFPFLDMSVVGAPDAGDAPIELVVIGHFHDRRGDPNTAICDATDEVRCNGFVVDGVYSVGGMRVPSSTVVDLEPLAPEPRLEPKWTGDDVDRLILSTISDFEILSRVALPGSRIHELEPSLGTGVLGIAHRPIAWVVTGLDKGAGGSPPVRRTFLIVDGTSEAYETVPWDVEPNVGFAPFALVPGTPSPPPTSARITLDLVGPEDKRVAVEIIDESGLLVSAAAYVPGADPRVNMPDVGDIAVANVAGAPNQVRLDWLGGWCDGPLRFTIRADGRTISLETLPFELPDGNFCPLMGVERGFRLTFSEPVPASEVQIVAAASAETVPVEVMGMPVIGVPLAIDHRDSYLDDTELAISGFAWGPSGAMSCTPIRQASPVFAQCPDGSWWLAEAPHRGSAGDGPAINLLIRRETYRAVEIPQGEAVQVIAIGHFDDHRAINCPAGRIEECRRNFVVDAILDPIRPEFDRIEIESLRPDPAVETIARPEDVIRSIGALQGPRATESVIASFAVPGSDVASFEPQAAQSADLTSASAVWVIRYLESVLDERPIIRTRLVIDGPPQSLPAWVFVPSPDGLLRETTIID